MKTLDTDPIIEEITAKNAPWFYPDHNARLILYQIKHKEFLQKEEVLNLIEFIPATIRLFPEMFDMEKREFRDALDTKQLWRDDIFERLLEGLKRMYS